MTRIKICGITNIEDALAAVEAGADALGFICVKESPRYVSPEALDEILSFVPPMVDTVAVVQHPQHATYGLIKYVQYYEEPDDWASLPWPLHQRIRVIRAKDEASLDEMLQVEHSACAILLDAYHDKLLGGSGHTFDWELAVRARRISDKPIILAGGLIPENVRLAVETVRPYAVDVASGLESSPGKKDHDKVCQFIREVREWDLAQR